MMTQLKTIQNDHAKGNPAVGAHSATEQLQHLLKHHDFHFSGSSHKKSSHYHQDSQSSKQAVDTSQESGSPAEKTLSYRGQNNQGWGKASHYSHQPAKNQSPYK